MRVRLPVLLSALAVATCDRAPPPVERHDIQISGGLVYDGTSAEGRIVDVFIDG